MGLTAFWIADRPEPGQPVASEKDRQDAGGKT
jgi:hypothetical protein